MPINERHHLQNEKMKAKKIAQVLVQNSVQKKKDGGEDVHDNKRGKAIRKSK